MSARQDKPIRHHIGAQGTFVLNNVSGSVRVHGTDTDEARVTARSTDGGDAPRLVVRRSEGALHVEPERRGIGFFGGSFSFGQSGIDFEVEVPRRARIEISTVSAELHAEGLLGEQRHKTVSGDVKLLATGGRVTLTTVSGDARVEADEALELEATTTSGDLELDAPDLALLRARTVSGDVRVRGALRPGPAHSVETVSGDLSMDSAAGLAVEVRRALDVAGRGGRKLVVGDGAALLRYRSMSGDVRVLSATTAGSPDREPAVATEEAAGETEQPAPPADDAESLEILRALERGEIDVEEASRRLEEVSGRA